MGLFGLFKPAWMSYDDEKTLNAVAKLTNKTELARVAKEARSPRACYFALKQVDRRNCSS